MYIENKKNRGKSKRHRDKRKCQRVCEVQKLENKR